MRVLDEDAFNGHSPLVGHISDNLFDLKSDGVALRYDTLDGSCTNDMS